jgi:hypothetical protein
MGGIRKACGVFRRPRPTCHVRSMVSVHILAENSGGVLFSSAYFSGVRLTHITKEQ